MTDNIDTAYAPYFAAAPPDKKFIEQFKPVLVESEDQLHALLDPHSDIVVGADHETNTLDYAVRANATGQGPVVGFSFSFTGYDGYYCPIRHQYGRNLPLRCLKVWYDFLVRNKTLWYQTGFDLKMLGNEGFDVTPIKALDILVVVYNLDNNIEKNNLKWAAEHYLGRPTRSFEDVAGKNARFDLITPEEGVYYAASDPAHCRALYDRCLPALREECPRVIGIDNNLSRAMLYYNDAVNYIDKATMRQMSLDVKLKIHDVERQIFRMVGMPFRLDSNRDISIALLSLGVNTDLVTKTGDMKVDKKSLAKIKHPIAEMIIERNSLAKQLTSYIDKFTQVDQGRFQLKICLVPTGRLASGNKDNPYFLKINSQNFTKTSSQPYLIEKTGPLSKDGRCLDVMGYSFTELPKGGIMDTTKQYAEGQSSYLNVRRAVTVPNRDEWYYCSIDFVQEELMLIGMLSREPVMMAAFRAFEDLYKKLAIEMFGAAAYNRDNRKKAKQCALSLNYDGNEWTLHNHSGLPLHECKQLFFTYWNTLRQLKRWKKQQVSQCIQNGGIVRTAYGRPRRLKWWLTHPERKKRGYGERSVVSHKVQGTAGDVMRLCMVNLEKEFFSIYPEDLRFSNAVHDELDFCVRKSVFDDLVPKMATRMCITVPGCELPLRTQVSIGYSYGDVFEFNRKEDGVWEPVPMSD